MNTVKVLLMLFEGMTGVRENGKRIDGLDEPLHCWITGTTAEDVKAAAKIIQEMIDMEIYNPDSEKAMALRVRCLTFNLRKTYNYSSKKSEVFLSELESLLVILT